MKRITLYIIALCSSIGMMAAEYEYVPVVREGVEWGYYDYCVYTPDPSPNAYRVQIKGDAIVNGINYKQVFRYTSCSIGDDAILMGWLRENDKKVYFLANPDVNMLDFKYYLRDRYGTGEFLIYDFNSEKVGDRVSLYNNDEQYPYYTVDKIEYIEINGKLRRKIDYVHILDIMYPIVEGQGMICYGGGTLFLPGLPQPANGCTTSVLNYIKTLDGVFEFKESFFNAYFDDPCVASVEDIGKDKLNITQSKDGISIDMPISNGVSVIELVDISGRVVYSKYVDGQSTFTLPTSSFAHGTYILIVSSESTKHSRKIAIK